MFIVNQIMAKAALDQAMVEAAYMCVVNNI